MFQTFFKKTYKLHKYWFGPGGNKENILCTSFDKIFGIDQTYHELKTEYIKKHGPIQDA